MADYTTSDPTQTQIHACGCPVSTQATYCVLIGGWHSSRFPINQSVLPPLIRPPLLLNNSVLIREVSYGEGASHIVPVLTAKAGCPL